MAEPCIWQEAGKGSRREPYFFSRIYVKAIRWTTGVPGSIDVFAGLGQEEELWGPSGLQVGGEDLAFAVGAFRARPRKRIVLPRHADDAGAVGPPGELTFKVAGKHRLDLPMELSILGLRDGNIRTLGWLLSECLREMFQSLLLEVRRNIAGVAGIRANLPITSKWLSVLVNHYVLSPYITLTPSLSKYRTHALTHSHAHAPVLTKHTLTHTQLHTYDLTPLPSLSLSPIHLTYSKSQPSE